MSNTEFKMLSIAEVEAAGYEIVSTPIVGQVLASEWALVSPDGREIVKSSAFHFNRNIESRLLIDLDLPGRDEFRKISARTYECIHAETGRFSVSETSRVGSIRARVWEAKT